MEGRTESFGTSGVGGKIANEFAYWPAEGATLAKVNEVGVAFTNLLTFVTKNIGPGNERYLAIVKTHLEEANMATQKAIVKTAAMGD